MDVTVNGETEAIAEPCSVAGLLAARGHDAARVVVERNGEILPRERFAQTLLCGATVWRSCTLWAADKRPNLFPAQHTILLPAHSRRRAQ